MHLLRGKLGNSTSACMQRCVHAARRPCRPQPNVSIADRNGDALSVAHYCTWPVEADATGLPDLGCCEAAAAPLQLQLYHPLALPVSVTSCCGPHPNGNGGDPRCYPLSRAALRRSLVFSGDARFRHFIDRVSKGSSVVIATIGSSVARGSGSTGAGHRSHPDGPSTKRFVEFLRRRYPPGKHIVHMILAVDGTTSAHRMSNLADLAAVKPDLVLWDYSTNDFGPAGSIFTPSQLRALYERVTRGLLMLPSRPAVLYLSMSRGFQYKDEASYAQQNEIALPVARAYGLPMVSYRDAVWPVVSDTSAETRHVYDSARDQKNHVMWYVHQLIADCMAYSWAAIEASMGGRSYDSSLDPIPPLPEEQRFADDALDALDPCPGGWLTVLSDEQSLRGAGVPASHGETPSPWEYDDARVGKQGWLMNASRSSLATRINHTLAMRDLEEGASLPLEPISFRVRFGEHPRLVVKVMKSYANFGRALWWIDGNQSNALDAHHEHDRFIRHCAATYKYCNARAAAISDAVRAQRVIDGCLDAALNNAWSQERQNCLFYRNGVHKAEPMTIDAHWTDLSSQPFSVALQGFGLVDRSREVGPRSWPLSRSGQHRLPLALYRADAAHELASAPGWHTVSFGLLWPQEAERALFKIMEVRSC